MKRANAHVERIHVRHIILILRALNPGGTPGVGLGASLAEEGHETSQIVVVAPGPVTPFGFVMMCTDDSM